MIDGIPTAQELAEHAEALAKTNLPYVYRAAIAAVEAQHRRVTSNRPSNDQAQLAYLRGVVSGIEQAVQAYLGYFSYLHSDAVLRAAVALIEERKPA